jgi:hypothetical protein
MFDERAHNYPQGYKEGPHCPNSTLVEICNSLAGNDRTPDNFCTETMENPVFSRGIISLLKSADFYPVASCAISNKMLDRQLEFVKHDFILPTEEEIIAKSNGAKTVDEKAKVFKTFDIAKENFNSKKTIIERWRNVIFNTCCATTTDEENPHFRRFDSVSELTEDEIIDRVKSFADALQKIIGYKKESLGWWGNEADNCPRSPSGRHYGGF